MSNYNKLPADAVIISVYDDIAKFFIHCTEEESRSVMYNENVITEGLYSLRIFWVNKEKGLGYGIADNWKEKSIVWYRFGSDDAWLTFNRGFAAQFRGDNS